MNKIPFRNKEGKTILMDGSTTIEELVKLGVTGLRMATRGEQLEENEWGAIEDKRSRLGLDMDDGRSLLMVNELFEVPFPDCARRCSFIQLMGAGECDSMCIWKFNNQEAKDAAEKLVKSGKFKGQPA